jgi:cytochrome P450
MSVIEARPLSEFSWPSDEVFQDPYPFYEALRREGVYQWKGSTPWGADPYLVTRWADVANVLKHPELFVQRLDEDTEYQRFICPVPHPKAPAGALSPYPVFFSDGEEHKLKRSWNLRLVERERMRAYEPAIRTICNELIDAFIARGECEWRGEFAELLPNWVMCEVLGVSRDDAPRFNAKFADREGRYEGLTQWERISALTQVLYDYIEELVLERYKEPRDDFFTELLKVQVERDGGIDLNYQIAQGAILFLAGAETTAMMLSNLLLLLCRNPDVMEQVRNNRSLVEAAVEESMRLEMPGDCLPRRCVTAAEVGGVEIPVGATVMVFFAAGNRDPEVFEDPDSFRLDRPGLAKKNLVFGRGSHFCIGAPLARLEGRLALEQVLERTTNIQIDEARSDFAKIPHENAPKKLQLTFEAI